MKKLIALSLIFPVAVAAAPGTTTTYFMSEPASLFDIGMFRLQTWANQSERYMGNLYWTGAKTIQQTSEGSIHADYDPDDDMIYVYFSVTDEQATPQQMEDGCREVMRLLRINTSKSIWRMFTHYGQEFNPPNKAMVDGLYEKVELRCFVSDYQSQGRFWATLPIRGDFGGTADMTIGKWRMKNE